jgi:hypothetical protein
MDCPGDAPIPLRTDIRFARKSDALSGILLSAAVVEDRAVGIINSLQDVLSTGSKVWPMGRHLVTHRGDGGLFFAERPPLVTPFHLAAIQDAHV